MWWSLLLYALVLPSASLAFSFRRINHTVNANSSFGPDISRYAVGALPSVTFSLPQSWAGQIPVPGTSDDELFFWLFASEHKSNDLIVWLNGGPGCASLDGAVSENGPLGFFGQASEPSANPYSWTQLANVLYIDQPVGTGYSTGSSQATNNSQVTSEFYSWLKSFYMIFPGLKGMNTHFMGESYAGVYIPYLTQTILGNIDELPINLKSISMGDPTIGNPAALTDIPVVTYLHQHNNTLDIPQDILTVFDQANELCGFSTVLQQLQYPPHGPIFITGDPEGDNYRSRKLRKRQNECDVIPTTPSQVNQSISCSGNGGCATFAAAVAYLTGKQPCFSVYNINYNCQNTPDIASFSEWLNLPQVRAAIHAPNKTFAWCNQTVDDTLAVEDVIPPTFSIMPSILEQGIPIHIYSGDDDLLLDHIGTELAIQNMTWCGEQGFQATPNKTFRVDGKVTGNWGYERGLSYHHFLNAGHAVPHDQPAAAFAFVRDFVVGSSGYA